MRQQELEDELRKKSRLLRDAEAVKLWRQSNTRGSVKQRTAMLIAAYLLDDAKEKGNRESDLADLLRWATPVFAKQVASIVAAHALIRGFPEVWDALAATDAMHLDAAAELFDDLGTLTAWPDPGWLVEGPDSSSTLETPLNPTRHA